MVSEEQSKGGGRRMAHYATYQIPLTPDGAMAVLHVPSSITPELLANLEAGMECVFGGYRRVYAKVAELAEIEAYAEEQTRQQQQEVASAAEVENDANER